MVLLFLKINSFSWSTFSSVLLIDECHKHLESSAEVTSHFNFETQSKTAFFKLSAYKTLLLTCCNTPLLTGIISSIYQLMHTYSWIYIYIYILLLLLFIKCLPTVLVHPEGEILTHAQNYIYGYCNVVTLVNKHKVYHMWILQRYLQLLEQYLALWYVLRVIYNVKNPCLQYVDTFKT
jgi:hypothetical protein